MHKKGILIGLGSLLVIGLFIVGANKVIACTQGCTPGFWKNHVDMWYGFTPYQTLGEVLCPAGTTIPAWEWPAELIELRDVTLIDALSFRGGPDLLAAARIMLRQAVASLLNTAHPDVHHFEPGVEWVISIIRSALSSGERDFMLWRGFWFQTFNELPCPLGRGGPKPLRSAAPISSHK